MWSHCQGCRCCRCEQSLRSSLFKTLTVTHSKFPLWNKHKCLRLLLRLEMIMFAKRKILMKDKSISLFVSSGWLGSVRWVKFVSVRFVLLPRRLSHQMTSEPRNVGEGIAEITCACTSKVFGNGFNNIMSGRCHKWTSCWCSWYWYMAKWYGSSHPRTGQRAGSFAATALIILFGIRTLVVVYMLGWMYSVGSTSWQW